MTTAFRTIRDHIRWAISEFTRAEIFFGHGSDNAWDEACHLVLSSLYLPYGLEQAVFDAALSQKEHELVMARIQERVETRAPLAYILGETYFAGLKFKVTPAVLIPRSPLGEWIQASGQPWMDVENTRHILDIGTGSGCIAIACAHYFPLAQVDAIDLSKEALAVAKENVLNHNVQGQVRLIQSDVFNSLEDERYDLIITNPPYVDSDDIENMPEEFHHEPIMGLAAGADGLDIARRILREAKDHLTEDGILVLEVGNSQHAVMEQYADVPFTWLDFQNGGDGVLLLTRQQLEACADQF